MSDSALPGSALKGVVVLDIATLLAGPFAATTLADHGADVIKVEHPRGDPLRQFGHIHDGASLLWKIVNRNKRSVTLDLSTPAGRDLFLALAKRADVVIENFRPGTLERWGIGPDVLLELNPRLILTRVTGFGQDGPYAHRAGFGTLAEAMSGLAAMSGAADGPPLLPSFPLADVLAGLQAANATLIALHARAESGRGQVADVAISEAMIGSLGAQFTHFDLTGHRPARTGNVSQSNAPRNVYRCADRRWVAISAPALSVAQRVMLLIGRADLADQPWFATGMGRVQHRDEIDSALAEWIGKRPRDEVVRRFTDAEAAVAPIYEVDDVLSDPHFVSRETFVRVPDSELGSVLMPGVTARLSETPGSVCWAGPLLGEHTEAVLGHIFDTTKNDAKGSEQ